LESVAQDGMRVRANAGTSSFRREPSLQDALRRAEEHVEQRPSVAEFPNADCRNRGLTQFRVRGIVKAKAQTLWHVLSYNFTRMLNLNFLQVVMAH
jgi:hypothetical protein